MRSALKLLIGLLSVLPLLWIALILFTLFAVPAERYLSDSPTAGGQLAQATIKYGVPLAVIVLIVVTAYDLYVLMKSNLAESQKVLWIVLLLMWFPLAAPVFWYQRIWHENRA